MSNLCCGTESIGMMGLMRSGSFGGTESFGMMGLMRSGSFGGTEMMGLMRSGSFGSKRVSFSSFDSMDSDDCYDSRTPTKRLCTNKKQDPIFTSQQDSKSLLDSLPEDILIRVLCSVEHDDLKNLIFVSKSISDATLIAKKLHFEYSTPRKAVGFRDDIVADDLNEYARFGALAPKGSRIRKFRTSQKKLDDISVTLFD